MSPGSVTLFVPCYVDQLRPAAGIAAVETLESLGHTVEVREAAICCGQPFTNSGCVDEGRRATELWYERMDGGGPIVVLSSSCAVHLRHVRPRGSASSSLEIHEFCEFLSRYHGDRDGGRLERTICLHSSCHGIRDSRADRAAREVLGTISGLDAVQAERADECCGFGGSFSTAFPDLSVRMGEDRLDEIAVTDATEVTATDVSCLLHLEGIARAQGRSLVFRHIAEVVREALP